MSRNVIKANVERIVRQLLDGEVGRQIAAEAETERSTTCAQLRQEFERGQSKHLAKVATLAAAQEKADAEVAALKAQLEPLENERMNVAWALSDARAAMTEHRDRLWKALEAVADPQLAIFRADIEGRQRALATLGRVWDLPRGNNLLWHERTPQRNNQAAIDAAGRYLLNGLDQLQRWAQTGVQGELLAKAYADWLEACPRVPMSAADQVGVLPGA